MRRLLIALLLVVGSALPGAAAPTPSPGQEPEDPIQVLITEILPRSPRPGDPIRIVGRLHNSGSADVTNLRVRAQIGARITTRSELQQADSDRPPTFRRTDVEPATTTLAPGGTTTFDLLTSTAGLGLFGIGVYPLDVVARGNAGNGFENLGLAPTFMPWFGTLTPKPIRVAVLWPLTDAPHRKPDGSFTDDVLAARLSPAGRLGRLLDVVTSAQQPSCEPSAAPTPPPSSAPSPAPAASPGSTPPTKIQPVARCEPVKVTVAVDPDLLETVAQMTTPYSVNGKPGAGTAAAAGWLGTLRSAGLQNRLLSLPFADPDVTALSRGDDPRNRVDLLAAATLGAEVTTKILGITPDPAVAWPPPGPVPPNAAVALALTGARSVVLDPEAYDDGAVASRRTPNTRSVYTTSATGAPLDGLVVEPELSALLGAAGENGRRVAEQRFLAESAIISLEAPGRARTLLLALPRGKDVERGTAIEQLRDLGRVPWMCPVGLGDVATGQARCLGEVLPDSEEPVGRGDVRTDTAGSLSASFLSGVTSDRDRANQLTDAVLSADPNSRDDVAATKGLLRRAIARAESSVGRTQPDLARQQASLLRAEMRRLTNAVVVRGGRSLLTSSKGTLSVSVENTLPYPIQVRVVFTSRTATLTDAETELLTIQPKNGVQAKVTAQAQRSGQFLVFARVVDRQGRPFGAETEVIVRSTQFGKLTLVVTFAAFGVLLVAAGIRIARRAHASRTDG